MANNIDILLQVKDQATQAIKNVSGEIDKMKGEAQKASKSIGDFAEKNKKNFKGMAIAGAATFGAVAFAVNKTTTAYMAQERAEARLEQIATKVTGATKEQIEGFKSLASELQKVGVVGDEVIISGQSQLASFTKNHEVITVLSKDMADLAVATYGVNVSQEQMIQTANLMGKALQGQLGALTRTGVLVGDDFKTAFEEAGMSMSDNFAVTDELAKKYQQANTELERAEILSQIISDNYGGLNEATRNTAEGGLKAFNNAMGDVNEAIGKGFIPMINKFSETMLPIAERLGAWIEKNDVLVVGVMIAVGAIGAIIGALGTLGLLIPKIIAGAKIMGLAIGALTGPVGLVILAIASLIAMGVALYRNWDTVTANAKVLWENFVTNLQDHTKILIDNILFYFNNLRDNLNIIYDNIRSAIVGVWEGIRDTILGIVDSIVSGITDRFAKITNKVSEMRKNLTDNLQFFGGNIRDNLGAMIPGRATGGPIRAGSPYMVGERGPELIIPKSNGTVIPNNQLGGGITINFGGVSVRNDGDIDKMTRAIQEKLTREMQLYKQGIYV